MTRLRIALRPTPLVRAFLEDPHCEAEIEHIEVKPIHRAFRPMVEHAEFDASELAIVTAIQAVAHGRPIVPLPITIAARFQHRCLVQNAERTDLGPSDLAGKTIAVRAYSQTTGTWVRTILDTEFGVDIPAIRWLTQEGPHVSDAGEPTWVARDADGADPATLLASGEADAAIFGNDMPKEPWIKPVIPAPDQTSEEVFRRNGVVHINHVVAVSRHLVDTRPDLATSIVEGFVAAKAQLDTPTFDLLPMGEEAMRPSIDVLIGSMRRQGLIDRDMTFDDVFGEAVSLLA